MVDSDWLVEILLYVTLCKLYSIGSKRITSCNDCSSYMLGMADSDRLVIILSGLGKLYFIDSEK